ncbi:MAG TPA: sugar ABC transporter permease [Candidatus Bathyarchaeia archaeon]|nr:sugar ABC transporter permease [Candidatus Bathyarchaeia archaeon]
MRQGFCQRVWGHRHFYAFISPFFILFGIFGLYPLIFSFYLSFTQWDGLTEMTWVGLANFRNMIHDELFLISLWNTLVIGVLYIPPMFLAAFVFALALNTSWLKLRGVFRAAFFMPCVTPMVVVAIVFSLIYSQDSGLLNYALGKVGELFPSLKIEPIPWLTSDRWFKPSVALLLVWRWTGYNMVLMLAGLQGISTEYYEAARIDGAGLFQRMWHITLPLMRPVFVFCAIMSLIGTVYMFDEVFVLTQGGLGGPGVSGINFGLYLFNTSFADFKFGYASSMAYTLAFFVFMASLLILRLRKSET